jgi:hypothetical protein
MSHPKRIRWFDWLGCSLLFAFGLFVNVVTDHARKHGTTPEAELQTGTGPATDVTISKRQGSEYLWLNVAGYRVEYSTAQPGYARLMRAIQDQELITVGVSTKPETFFPRQGWVPLYTLNIGPETLLTYQHTITHGYRASTGAAFIGPCICLLSLWGLWTCYRDRAKPALTAKERRHHLRNPNTANTASRVTSIMICGAIMFATLQPESIAVLTKVFGETPLQLPIKVFLVLFMAVVLAPMPIALRHYFRLHFNSTEDQIYSASSLSAQSRQPQTRQRSKRITVGIGLFYLGLMIGWIIYAGVQGI